MNKVQGSNYFLLVINGVSGIWALFFPHEFHTSFPGFGFHWIDIYGPYNEHLIRDVGAFFCGLTSLSVFAILDSDIKTVRLMAYSNLVFSTPHFVYHFAHMHMFPTALDRFLGISSLFLVAFIPGLILFWTSMRPARIF
ncbi:hypothetical protein [Spirosoma sp.]|uniref:hypothetical protein n=1 Tax=Spirosoma sp. TaxID=1899569 RepID=UPI003B3A0601